MVWHELSAVKKNVDEVYTYLQELPVHFIVFDDYARRGKEPKWHHKLLRRAIESNPEVFRRANSFEVVQGERRFNDILIIYENLLARDRTVKEIRVDLHHTLRRSLDYRVP